MPLRRDQIPTTVTFFSTEEATGLERRAFVPATKLVQRGLLALGQPGFQLLLFLGGGGFQLFVVGDFFRPFAARRLPVSVDQIAIHRLADRLAVLHAETLKQQALRDFRLIHRQAHRYHLAAINLTAARGQQNALTVDGHRHRRPGFHALAQRRRRHQRHEQGLRRAGRQVDTAEQCAAVIALDLHIDRHGPVHRALQTQAHHARLRPVPGTGLRGQTQGRTGHRVERHPAQYFAFCGLFGVGLGQIGVFGGDFDHVRRADKVEQGLLTGRRCQQRGSEDQGENGRQRTADHKNGVLPNDQ